MNGLQHHLVEVKEELCENEAGTWDAEDTGRECPEWQGEGGEGKEEVGGEGLREDSSTQQRRWKPRVPERPHQPQEPQRVEVSGGEAPGTGGERLQEAAPDKEAPPGGVAFRGRAVRGRGSSRGRFVRTSRGREEAR